MIPLPVWPYWPLVRKLWWIVPVTALIVTAGVFRIQRDNARADLETANRVIAAQEAAGRAQAEAAKQSEAAWQKAAERLVGETSARLAAVAADRDSLAQRLRAHAASTCACAVPETPAGPGGNDAALGDGGGVSTADAALDEFARKARRCDAVEEFWQRYAEAVGVPVK